MRKTYISPEFRYQPVPGTFNMREVNSMFGSKMMDIEDFISIDNNNIIYYQTEQGEQLNINLERNNGAVLYNTVEDKRTNHSIEVDSSQAQSQLESNTRWIITVDLRRILSNFLFATLKSRRTFEGVRNEATSYNNVNDAARQYVLTNLLSRYTLGDFKFWVRYVPLSTQGTLRYKNSFAESAQSGSVTTKIQTSYNYDKSSVRIGFNQELPSNTHVFEYYFTMNYTKL